MRTAEVTKVYHYLAKEWDDVEREYLSRLLVKGEPVDMDKQQVEYFLTTLYRHHADYKGCGISPIVWGLARCNNRAGLDSTISQRHYETVQKQMNYSPGKYRDLYNAMIRSESECEEEYLQRAV